MNRIRTWLRSDSAKRVYRTFVIAFAAIFVPGALGWLNGLTDWARSEGQAPFPDARSLAFVGVAAIVAGVIAAFNLVVVWLEDATGTRVLRNGSTGRILGKAAESPRTPRRTEQGAGELRTAVMLAALVVLILVILALVGVL